MIRVLVADDHEMVLRGLADGFREHPDFELVGALRNGALVAEKYREYQPDVALLDYRLPGANGDEITKAITKRDSSAKVVILSSFEREEDVWRSVIAGAMGYIPKTKRFTEVCEGIREVVAGREFFPPEILKKIRVRERREKLTDRELEILRLLSKGMTNKDVARHLGLSDFTVKTHVSNVLAKIDAKDRTQAVVKAFERGLLVPKG